MAEVSGRGIARNPGIDLLRGVSIVLVVIHHTALRIPLTKTGAAAVLPQRLLRALNWNGANAVTMFFVISGFLITTMSLRRWGSLGAVEPGTFYWQRMTRIVPCLLVLLAVLSVFDLMGVPDYAITRADQSLPRAIVSALGLHLNWYEGVTGYLPGGWDVLWSLSIEEAFYLAFPLLCLMSARAPWLLAVGLTMLALSLPYELNALADASEVWQEKAYLPGMSAIASGIGAAWLANHHRCPGKGVFALAGWSGTVLMAAFLLNEPFFWHTLGQAGALILTFSVALVLMAFHWGWGTQVLARRCRVLRSFGVTSYEIYLTHMFVVFPVVGLFRLSGASFYWGWPCFLVTLGLSLVLGACVARTFSLPVERWLRRGGAIWPMRARHRI